MDMLNEDSGQIKTLMTSGGVAGSESNKTSNIKKDCVYTFSDNCDSDEGELKFKIKNLLQSPPKCDGGITKNVGDDDDDDDDDEEEDDDDDDDNEDEEDNDHEGDSLNNYARIPESVSEMINQTLGVNTNSSIQEIHLNKSSNYKLYSFNSSSTLVKPLIDTDLQSNQNITHQLPLSNNEIITETLEQPLPPPPPPPPALQSQFSHHHDPFSSDLAVNLNSLEADTSPNQISPTSPLSQTNLLLRVPNGSLPKTGKPMAYAIEKKTAASAAKVRRRPKRKALVAMYQSQISDNNMGIKLKLKKSDICSTPQRLSQKSTSSSSSSATSRVRNHTTTTTTTPKATITTPSATSGRIKNKKPTKTNRKRARRPKAKDSSDETDDDIFTSNSKANQEKRPRKEKVNNNREPVEQTPWGILLPIECLENIFEYAVNQEGTLPTLIKLGKVCHLWHRVSLTPKLWNNLDLARWTKERFRTELKLKWFIENRLSHCRDLNLSNWKVTNIDCVLNILADRCPNIVGITLSGWKGFSSDDLTFMMEHFKLLERIDLSSINIELNPSRSAVGLQPLCAAIQSMNNRLTHLYLAHNRLAGIPQIITTLSTYCPNLVLLDLSNVQTIAISHGILHIEKLQQGCQKLKVLRVTNSHITLAQATLQEQMNSPGFPDLEELSVASLADESRLINDEFLQRILKTSTKLQLLDVRGCARLTHDSLIRLPTWDLKHLFLSGCSVTRDLGSGLELIASKWAHSLIEFDLAWANVQSTIDAAIRAIAEKGSESPLNHLNLCGSSVSLDAVKEILIHCLHLNSINLASCRGLPRGVKRLLQGDTQLKELRENLGVALKMQPTSLSLIPPSTTTTITESKNTAASATDGTSALNS